MIPASLLTSLNTFDFKNSILINLLQAIFAVSRSEIAPIRAFSPLTLAGWAGLSLSAMQLMPFKLLDGGNIAIAMFGHRQTVQIARITRLVLLAIALLAQPWLRIYSLLLFLLPTPDPLILNEHIEISKNRDLIGIILLAIALLIILPVPKFLF
jgi:membrane-associated protease RseP (regulator of RpoE activity)